MLRQIFFFEHLIEALWLSQSAVNFLYPSNFNSNQPLFLAVWVALMVLKYKFEGFQINAFLFFIVEAVVYFQSSLVLNLVVIVLFILQTKLFAVYNFPPVQGKFSTGYRSLYFGKNHAALFYPAANQTQDTTYCENLTIIPRGYEVALKRLPIPEFLFCFHMSFIKRLKLGVNKDADIIVPAPSNGLNKKYPVIIFNHALATSNLVYMSYFRDWVSRGYVVISIDTNELVLTPHAGPVDPVRFAQLESRYKQIEEVLDFIHDKARYQKFFGADIELDTGKVSVSGHSFGGAAAVLASYRSPRITGACILIDPWLWPVEMSLLQKPMGKPVLVVRSENYYDNNKTLHLHEKMEAMVKSNTKHTSFSCYFKGTTHSMTSDPTYFFAALMKQKNLVEITHMTNELIDVFLQLVVHGEGKAKSKEEVLEKFRQWVEENNYPRLLKVDD